MQQIWYERNVNWLKELETQGIETHHIVASKRSSRNANYQLPLFLLISNIFNYIILY